MIAEALSYPFFRQALLAALLASIACGIIGTFVVVKQISSISGGLSHAAFGGLGLGFLLGFEPILGAAGFCVLAAVLIGLVYRRQHQSLDTLISMVWSVGMALGLLFINMAPRAAPDLNSYLFGSLLLVPFEYLRYTALFDIGVVVIVALYFRELQAVAFDEEFAEVTGVSVDGVMILLLVLTSLAVVVLIRVVGVIMMIALLATPAVIARHWSDNLRGMMIFSVVISMFCTTVGLFLSYMLPLTVGVNAPVGPLIIILAAVLFALSSVARAIRGAR